MCRSRNTEMTRFTLEIVDQQTLFDRFRRLIFFDELFDRDWSMVEVKVANVMHLQLLISHIHQVYE